MAFQVADHVAHEMASGYHEMIEKHLGLASGAVLAWFAQYGIPITLKLLPVLLKGGQGLSAKQILDWVVLAAAAIHDGKEPPPLPNAEPETKAVETKAVEQPAKTANQPFQGKSAK